MAWAKRRSFFRGKKRPSVWLALANFQADNPATADRLTIPFQPALASGTRICIAATLLTSSGISLTVGGESGKTRRIVGDVRVSALTTAAGTVLDAFVREAIMIAERDSLGNVLATELDLFSNTVLGTEDILQMRESYFGTNPTTNGIVQPNVYHQWFQDTGLQRWDTQVTRRLDDNHVLVYVICFKKLANEADPTLAATVAGELRGIIAR